MKKTTIRTVVSVFAAASIALLAACKQPDTPETPKPTPKPDGAPSLQGVWKVESWGSTTIDKKEGHFLHFDDKSVLKLAYDADTTDKTDASTRDAKVAYTVDTAKKTIESAELQIPAASTFELTADKMTITAGGKKMVLVKQTGTTLDFSKNKNDAAVVGAFNKLNNVMFGGSAEKGKVWQVTDIEGTDVSAKKLYWNFSDDGKITLAADSGANLKKNADAASAYSSAADKCLGAPALTLADLSLTNAKIEVMGDAGKRKATITLADGKVWKIAECDDATATAVKAFSNTIKLDDMKKLFSKSATPSPTPQPGPTPTPQPGPTPNPPKPSKDELGIQSDVEKSLKEAVASLGTKKVTLDATAKKFTIEADSTVTELSAKDIFKDAKFAGMTQVFTLNPAGGSVTVASDASKLAVGYAKIAEGDTFMVTLAFAKGGKTSTFNFTVVNKKKNSQPQPAPTPSTDPLNLKDKIVPALKAAVSKLSAKKITIDADAKKFTIEADSKETTLSATEIFSGTDFTGMTQVFTLNPASGSVTVANPASNLTIGYAAKADGETYTATLTFTKDGKSSKFDFTVINKKQQPPKDELSLKAKVTASLTAAVEDLKKKDINVVAAENKFVIGPDSAVTALDATEIFKGADYTGMTQEFKILSAAPSVTVGNPTSKLDIKVAGKPEGCRAEVQLTFKKGTQVSEFKFTIINKKQNALRDDFNLKDEAKKTLAAAVDKLKGKNIIYDTVEKKFVIKPDVTENAFYFSDCFPTNNNKYKDLERDITITPQGGSIMKGFGSEGVLDIGLAKDTKNGDTFTVMFKFTKDEGGKEKVSEFKFTFVNMRKKIYDKRQIKGQIDKLVQDLNDDQSIWLSTKKYMYQYQEKGKAILLPEKGTEHDIKDVKLTWGLKKGRENKAEIKKNKEGKTVLDIDKSDAGQVVLTVTVALPGENLVFDELPDSTNQNAWMAFVLNIES